MMTLTEYIAAAKGELDEMAKRWEANHKIAPEDWPMEMEFLSWYGQECMFREDPSTFDL